MKYRKKLSLVLGTSMLVASLSLAGCGAKPEESKPAETEAATSAVTEAATEEATEAVTEAVENNSERSVTITDMGGTEVTINGEVKSIINLWPGGTTSFFVMGAGDLIKGVGHNGPAVMNDWTEFFYPGAREIPCLTSTEPTIEEVLNINPDLVIMHPRSARGTLQADLIAAGIPTVNLNFMNYDDMSKALTTLGEILGGEYQEKLNYWVSTLNEKKEKLEALTADVPEEEKPVVFYSAGMGDSLLGTLAGGSIVDQWVTTAGGRLATKDVTLTENDEITAEELFNINPDIIMVGGSFQQKLLKELKESDEWKDLKAVTDGKVFNSPYGCYNWDRFGMESLLELDYAFMCFYPELAAENGITEESMVKEVIDFYQYFNGKEMTEEEASNMLAGLLYDGRAENLE